MCDQDIERLLIASLEIARLKREASLHADAIAVLRETLADRDQEIALLRASLDHANCRVQLEQRAS